MKLLVFGLLALPLAGQTLDDCRKHRKYGRYTEADGCFIRLIDHPRPAVRAEALWALRRINDANNQFKLAVAAEPKNPELRVRWGRLFVDGLNPAEAAKLYQEALELKPDYPPALLALAEIASGGFESKAVELAGKAIQLDPKLWEAQELLAKLALEDNNPDKAIEEADQALKIAPEALNAMAVRATIELLRDKPATAWFERIAAVNPKYGEAYALAGHFFVLNRRYEEGIKLYRKALELNPDLDEARSELGVNLMRLGEEKEAREHLERAHQNGHKDPLTTNTLRLMDSYKNFVTRRTPATIVRVHKKEADLIGPYVESELVRAIATFEKKYKVKLNRPVQVEVYPDHEDFAVRTLGMPGLGALGVTFGYVVAMDSPSGRRPGTFHWASTLWHELSHVFVLTATKHRVPRWFTEGMAVHEETATSPDWGDRLDPQAIDAIQKKKLLPVAQLDRGFIRPSYPSQVVISYFQAGKICDFINQTWGYQTLLDMMHSFGDMKSTPEVIETHLKMKPEQFDEKFLAWLHGQVGKTVENFPEWRKRMRELSEHAKASKHDEVIAEGLKIRDLYPDFLEKGSVYELLADAYLAKNNKPAAIAQLERYSALGGRGPELLKKLATLQEEAGNAAGAARTLERLLFIYPMEEDLHRRLGDLWLAAGNTAGAIREFHALIAARPIDQAASRLSLARALRAGNRVEEAKEQILLALEAAPGFKPAQKLLLELSQ